MTPREPSAGQTVADTLRKASRRLAAAGTSSPRLDAEVLLRHVLRLNRTALFLQSREAIHSKDLAAFEELIAGRLAGSPVAYLTGEREFAGMPFVVKPGALIPRPETEQLVEWAWQWLQSGPPATVLDIGTGSGAIALSLARHLDELEFHTIVASDVSLDALTVAVENRRRLKLEDRVTFVRGDLASWFGGQADLVLANLPYLTPDQYRANPDLTAEPEQALVGGPDGLDLIRRLLHDAPRWLAPTGAIMLEIDPSQAESVRDLATSVLPGARTTIRHDFGSLQRYAIIKMGQANQ